MLAGRDPVEIDLRAVIPDKLLKQRMGVFQFRLEFLPIPRGIFAEQGQGALVIAGGDLLEIDIQLFQQPMKIRDLRQHADRADNGERGRDDPVRHTGHHITAARGHLVHRGGQFDAAVPDAPELRGAEAIAMHRAAAALQERHDLVLVGGDREDRGDLLAQRGYPAGLDIALKVQHEDLFSAAGRLVLAGLFLLFNEFLEVLFRHDPGIQHQAHVTVFIVDIFDAQAMRFLLATADDGK